ncbi:hypothetical protein [Sphingomonas solaris]|uniref:Uncharacterized protein n=1 Tax=Alterirhizorhabdus solaris TaxID=2529389 RepID=A0A558R7D8_9SPHN|nr:hypothetical protein [Sphingomonas solaris]TVV75303.1 hypothetical protein FOY91_07600 [Sphingomonas solaris]
MADADAPIDALAAGVLGVVRVIDGAAAGIDAAFAAELRARHGVPEWDQPAPMNIEAYAV